MLRDIQTLTNLCLEACDSVFVDVDVQSPVVITTYWKFPTQ